MISTLDLEKYGIGGSMTFRNGAYESKGFDNWMTPQHIIDELENEFGELYDPCPKNHDFSFDGLEITWSKDKVCFVNPPYSQIKEWVKKCYDEWVTGSTIILLIPARTCTRYFHDYINNNSEIRFIKGRVKFVHPDGRHSKPAPFPSILCIFRNN